jgi:hypothetical protein
MHQENRSPPPLWRRLNRRVLVATPRPTAPLAPDLLIVGRSLIQRMSPRSPSNGAASVPRSAKNSIMKPVRLSGSKSSPRGRFRNLGDGQAIGSGHVLVAREKNGGPGAVGSTGDADRRG